MLRLVWACAWVWSVHGVLTVSVMREHMGSSHLGGTPASNLSFRSTVVVLHFIEIIQYIVIILGMNFLQIGDGVWRGKTKKVPSPK